MSKRRTTVVVGIAGIAAALALAGCSSSSSSGSGGSTPSSNQTFSLGDNQVDTGGTLPSYWPSDVPVPTGLEYAGGAKLETSISGSFKGTTSVSSVQQQLTTDFKAQGWTSSSSFGGNDTGGVTVWKKGNQTAQVTVATQDGNTVVNETVITTK